MGLHANLLISLSADQFARGARLLHSEIEDGVHTPFLMCAAFAIELYLKSLNADRVDIWLDGTEIRLTAKSRKDGHFLADLYREVPDDAREGLEHRFAERRPLYVDTLETALRQFDRLFVDCRYPFEKAEIDLSVTDVDSLMALVDFMEVAVGKFPWRA